MRSDERRVTVPASCSCRPIRTRNSVVLPVPLLPIRPIRSLSFTANDTSLNNASVPNAIFKSRTSTRSIVRGHPLTKHCAAAYLFEKEFSATVHSILSDRHRKSRADLPRFPQGIGRAQEHPRRSHRQAQQGGQRSPCRSQDQGATCRSGGHTACAFARRLRQVHR